MSDLFCCLAELSSIAPAITALPWPEPAFMWLERIPTARLGDQERQDGIRLDRYDPQTPFDTWGRGRIFCVTGELRWEYADGRCHAVYCGDEHPAGFTPYPLATVASVETTYYLWGKRVTGADLQNLDLPTAPIAYIEERIPRILFYPDIARNSPDHQRIRVKVREWYAPDGTLAYARWYGLETAE
jgi:hypothetical protein